jgi:hypothetical protein
MLYYITMTCFSGMNVDHHLKVREVVFVLRYYPTKTNARIKVNIHTLTWY